MKILFISLGCDKNLVDSEEMLGLLNSRGYTFTDDETEADVIIINTCCFINDAKEESVQTILEMAEYKKTGKCKALIVTGCMAQRYKQEILDEVSEVDQVLGTTAYEKIVEAVDEALAGSRGVEEKPLSYLPQTDAKRMVTTGGHYAYLKIAEGCNKCCTYCIIPKLRGRYRSVPMERLIEQAKELAAQGVKELILVAQETTVYGVDLYGKKSLHLLLEQLCQISGLRWIRILYCYPEEIYEDLIQTMKREEKIEMIQEIIEKKDPYIGLYAELLLSMGDMKLNYRDYMITEPINCSEELKRVFNADYDLCAALLTMVLREDHFSCGSFKQRFAAGQVLLILKRMRDILSMK